MYELDIFGHGAWVLRDDVKTTFYSMADVPCPGEGEWNYLPNGLDTHPGNVITANLIKINGLTPGHVEENNNDFQCCTPNDAAFSLYNANSHVCCSDGSVAVNANSC